MNIRCHLPSLRPRSDQSMDTSTVVPSRTIPSVLIFFGEERFWRRVDVVMLAWQRRALVMQFSHSGLCIVRRSCLRVTEALAHRIRAPPADTRWITTPWHVFNRSWTTKTHALSCVENLKPSAPLSTEVHAIRHLPLSASFAWPVCQLRPIWAVSPRLPRGMRGDPSTDVLNLATASFFRSGWPHRAPRARGRTQETPTTLDLQIGRLPEWSAQDTTE